MSSSRDSIHYLDGSAQNPVPRLTPPTVGDHPVKHRSFPLDDAIEALLSYIERAGWPAAIAACVRGLSARSLWIRSTIAHGRAFAFGLGWSPAQLDNLAALDVSLVDLSQRPRESAALLHRLYSDGIRTAPERESAADRELRSRRQWSKPLDQLLAVRGVRVKLVQPVPAPVYPGVSYCVRDGLLDVLSSDAHHQQRSFAWASERASDRGCADLSDIPAFADFWGEVLS